MFRFSVYYDCKNNVKSIFSIIINLFIILSIILNILNIYLHSWWSFTSRIIGRTASCCWINFLFGIIIWIFIIFLFFSISRNLFIFVLLFWWWLFILFLFFW